MSTHERRSIAEQMDAAATREYRAIIQQAAAGQRVNRERLWSAYRYFQGETGRATRDSSFVDAEAWQRVKEQVEEYIRGLIEAQV